MKPFLPSRGLRTLAAACAMLAFGGALSACAPLIVGGAVVGGMMAVDRRTSGTQIEDQAIELKATSRISTAVADRGRVSVTSYNRMVLLSGEAATEADRSAIEQTVRSIENVRALVNELAVMGNSPVSARSSDLVVTGRVKAALVETKDLHAGAFKVVTERGIVYLMGRVTEREAARATDVARGVTGVQKVVRVFDLLTEAELAALSQQSVTVPPAAAASAPR